MKSLKLMYVLLLLSSVLLCMSCGGDSEDEEMIVEETCSDGLKNQDETGIDCGGVCDLCGPPIGSSTYFYGVVDGIESIHNGPNGGGSGLSSCSVAYDRYVNGGTWSTGSITNLTSLANVFLRKSLPIVPSQQDFYEMFAEGVYSYEPTSDCEDFRAYPVIRWSEEANEVWNSMEGSQPSDSYFEVTKRGAISGNSCEIEGRFSCTVFKAGASKKIESGEFKFILYLY